MQALLRHPRRCQRLLGRTTTHDHALIDRTTTRIEDTLTAHGYDISSEIKYVALRDEIASSRALTPRSPCSGS